MKKKVKASGQTKNSPKRVVTQGETSCPLLNGNPCVGVRCIPFAERISGEDVACRIPIWVNQFFQLFATLIDSLNQNNVLIEQIGETLESMSFEEDEEYDEDELEEEEDEGPDWEGEVVRDIPLIENEAFLSEGETVDVTVLQPEDNGVSEKLEEAISKEEPPKNEEEG
jgi:hypothetical protein